VVEGCAGAGLLLAAWHVIDLLAVGYEVGPLDLATALLPGF
jgi:hypothetical protein